MRPSRNDRIPATLSLILWTSMYGIPDSTDSRVPLTRREFPMCGNC